MCMLIVLFIIIFIFFFIFFFKQKTAYEIVSRDWSSDVCSSDLIQDEMDLHWIPVIKHWRLNERMYGGLQGLNKSETAAKHGEDQVKVK